MFNKNKKTLIKYPEGKTLTRYSVPSSITELSSHALALCPLLTDIELPDTLKTIGDEVCWSCDSLSEITIPASVTSVGIAPFVSCDRLEKITVDANNLNFTLVNGVLFDKSAATLIQYPAGKSDTQYDIPATVTRIAASRSRTAII